MAKLEGGNYCSAQRKFILLVFFFLVVIPSFSYADEVRRSHRLNQIRAATGKASTNDLYRSHIDAVFNRTPTSERNYSARQDASFEQAQQAKVSAELDAAYATGFTSQDFSELDNSIKEEEEGEAPRLEERVDASEKQYQIDRHHFYLEEKEEIKKTKESLKNQEQITEEKELKEDPLELKNNPYYFGRLEDLTAEEESNYEWLKPAIRHRLIHVEKWLPEEADAIMQGVETGDDMIIKLMKDAGYDYDEARDVVEGYR